MNFFEHQEKAKKRTTLLVSYYGIAVLFIVGMVNIVALAFYNSQYNPPLSRDDLILWTSGATLALIGVGTMIGIAHFGSNGQAVAKALGGIPIDLATTSPHEKKFINVVEEMSIASGIPVPSLWVIPDQSINAFAAGLTPSSVVIGVTRGALETLSRDELQGVVAHEFSHIFNGDMRLNLRLIGLLNGILMIAMVGRILMRTRGRKNPLPILGFGLFIIGYIGVFMSRLIKSAISRQREFLADASAVQFTRNPAGLKNALVKIGQGSSQVNHPKAEEVSHLFFANGLRSGLASLFATHPPLEDRIRAIDPLHQVSAFPVENKDAGVAGDPVATVVAGFVAPRNQISSEQITAAVAAPKRRDVDAAASYRAMLPEIIYQYLTDPIRAKGVVYALLLDEQQGIRQQQQQKLSAEDPQLREIMESTYQALVGSKLTVRLPIVEMAIPALRLLSDSETGQFLQRLNMMILIDNRVSPFEFAVKVFLEKIFRGMPQSYIKAKPDYRIDAQIVLSYLAYTGESRNMKAAADAFGRGYQKLDNGSPKAIVPWDECGPEAVRRSLLNLSEATTFEKEKLIAGFSACIGSDGVEKPEEWEVFRAFCEVLECPMPLTPPN